MAEKQNYVYNTKDLLSLTMESIMLLVHVKFSVNNMRRDWIKNSLQNDLHSLCEAGNRPTTLLLGDDHLKMTYLIYPISTATIRMISKPKRGLSSKLFFVPRQQTQSTISPTIPKNQTIQELTNIVRPRKKILYFPEMRVTKKIFTQRPQNLFFHEFN